MKRIKAGNPNCLWPVFCPSQNWLSTSNLKIQNALKSKIFWASMWCRVGNDNVAGYSLKTEEHESYGIKLSSTCKCTACVCVHVRVCVEYKLILCLELRSIPSISHYIFLAQEFWIRAIQPVSEKIVIYTLWPLFLMALYYPIHYMVGLGST